jgi:hypothetical protein
LKITTHLLGAFAHSREPKSPRSLRIQARFMDSYETTQADAFAASFSPFWQGAYIYRLSVSFLRFLGFFERGAWLENGGVSSAIWRAALARERGMGSAIR